MDFSSFRDRLQLMIAAACACISVGQSYSEHMNEFDNTIVTCCVRKGGQSGQNLTRSFESALVTRLQTLVPANREFKRHSIDEEYIISMF